MRGEARLRSYYRRADSFGRYLFSSPEAKLRLRRVLRNEGRFFGRRVLDIGCGGGALGFLCESSGRSYLGVDANPDMIRAARATARERGSSCTFLLRDVLRRSIPGRHDTVTLLGNTLGHFAPAQVVRLLGNISGSVRRGAHLIVAYRDVVGELLRGRWTIGKTYRTRSSRGTIRVTTVGADLANGTLAVRLTASWFRTATRSTHALWSPFILTLLVDQFGWRLVHRRRKGDQFVDVFRLDRPRVRTPRHGRGG